MSNQYSNVIATQFSMEGPYKRGNFWELVRKIEGFDHCRKLLKGALYEQNGHIIHDSIRKCGINGDQVLCIAPIVIDPNIKIEEYIAGNSAYLGNLYSHYGHFITEGLSRFKNFKGLNGFDNILFSPYIFDYPITKFTAYHKFFFDELGIDSSKVKILYKTSKLEKVTVYKQLWTINESVDLDIGELYSHLRLIDPNSPINGLRVFCSRKVNHRISNQKELEELFGSHGFEVIYPEDLSVEKQMAIYKGDNLIVSTSGSTLHNILFGRKNSRFIEIGDTRTPEEPHIMQKLANSLSVANYRFVAFKPSFDNCWDLNQLKKLILSL